MIKKVIIGIETKKNVIFPINKQVRIIEIKYKSFLSIYCLFSDSIRKVFKHNIVNRKCPI